MIKPYTIYDEDGRFWLLNTDTPPSNSTEQIYIGNFIEPRYNAITQTFYEGANAEQKQAAIDAIDLEYQSAIHNLIWLHLEKSKMREVTGEQYEIPQDVILEYNRLRAEFNTRKEEILNN